MDGRQRARPQGGEGRDAGAKAKVEAGVARAGVLVGRGPRAASKASHQRL